MTGVKSFDVVVPPHSEGFRSSLSASQEASPHCCISADLELVPEMKS